MTKILTRLIIVVLWCAISPESGFAAEPPCATLYGQWESIRIGGGGYLLNTVVSPQNPNIVYCNSDVGGLFKSIDAGRHWRMIHGSHYPALYNIRSIDVDPRNPDIILAAVGQQWESPYGLFRSENGGQSWTKVGHGQFFANENYRAAGNVLARNPSAPDTIYAAASYNGLTVSHDNGKSWSPPILSGYFFCDLKIDNRNSARLWLCAMPITLFCREAGKNVALKGGLFLSEDHGKSWQKINEKSPSEIHQSGWNPDLLFGIIEDQYPATSSDHGKTWQNLTSGLHVSSNAKEPERYSAMTAGPDFMLLGSNTGRFYRLNQGEESWTPVIPNHIEQGNWFLRREPGKWDHFGRATASITVDPTDPQHWFFTDWYAVYQSHDAGATWKLCIDGIEMTVIHCLSTDIANPQRIYLGMADNTVLVSDNNGAKFHSSINGTGNTKCIAMAGGTPARIYSTGPQNWDWRANALRVSADNGQHWSVLPAKGLPSMDQAMICTVAAPISRDGNEVYVARSGIVAPGQGGVYKSVDGGRSFQWDSNGWSSGQNFFAGTIWRSSEELAISRDGRHMVAISQKYSTVYFRNRDNSKWEKAATAINGCHYGVVADPFNPQCFYLLARNNGIYRSTDGGNNWSLLYPGDPVALTCSVEHKGLLAAALSKEEKILISRDDGKNWQEQDRNLPSRNSLKLCLSGNYLLAGTDGNGVFRLPIKPAR